MYPEDRIDNSDIDRHPQTFTDDGSGMASKRPPIPDLAQTDEDSPDIEPSTARALDMTEQNYEEQAAEAEAAMQGVQQDPTEKKAQPQDDELEDPFHINLDAD